MEKNRSRHSSSTVDRQFIDIPALVLPMNAEKLPAIASTASSKAFASSSPAPPLRISSPVREASPVCSTGSSQEPMRNRTMTSTSGSERSGTK